MSLGRAKATMPQALRSAMQERERRVLPVSIKARGFACVGLARASVTSS